MSNVGHRDQENDSFLEFILWALNTLSPVEL
jgi:hypothetical protein